MSELQHLVARLHNSNPDDHGRRLAAHALGRLGPHAGPFLEDALEDPDWRVRAEAAIALDRIHSFEARHALARVAVVDEIAYVREAARHAIGHLRAWQS